MARIWHTKKNVCHNWKIYVSLKRIKEPADKSRKINKLDLSVNYKLVNEEATTFNKHCLLDTWILFIWGRNDNNKTYDGQMIQSSFKKHLHYSRRPWELLHKKTCLKTLKCNKKKQRKTRQKYTLKNMHKNHRSFTRKISKEMHIHMIWYAWRKGEYWIEFPLTQDQY